MGDVVRKELFIIFLIISFLIFLDLSYATTSFGKIAFLCNSLTCNDGIEAKTIIWLRGQNWDVTEKMYNQWTDFELDDYDLIVCTDEFAACEPTNTIYNEHMSQGRPFVEISDYSKIRGAYGFGYINNVNSDETNGWWYTKITITNFTHPITLGFPSQTEIYFDWEKFYEAEDSDLKNMVIDLANGDTENQMSTFFVVDKSGTQGRYAWIGWHIDDYDNLRSSGITLLNNALCWVTYGEGPCPPPPPTTTTSTTTTTTTTQTTTSTTTTVTTTTTVPTTTSTTTTAPTTTIPNIIIHSPISDEAYGKRKILVNVTLAERVKYFYMSVNDDDFERLCRDCNSVNRYINMPEGEVKLRFKKVLYSGDIEYKDVKFIVDSIKPYVINVIPKKNSYVKCLTNFEAQYSENTVSNVSLFYGFNPFKEHFMSCKSGKREKCFTTIDLSEFDGQEIAYYFTVKSPILTDTSELYKLFVDCTIPIIILNSPENKTYDSRSVRLNISVSEDVKLEYSDNDGSFRRLCSRCDSYDRRYTFSYGSHELLIRATDNAGNEGYASIIFTTQR
jgi:hypothetical protein